MKSNFFKYSGGSLPLPVFFPDATRAVIRSLDSVDIESTKTPGILVNTFHLWKDLDKKILKKTKNIANFMNWKGAIISDSGGFQVGSLIKKGKKIGFVDDEGAHFKYEGKNYLLTPEESIRFQMSLGTDMVVVLDDFDLPEASFEVNKESVERTILWAKKAKKEFDKICKAKGLTKETRPYILGVVQGGPYPDLRKYCAEELVKIGFDGFGYGGDGKKDQYTLDYEVAQIIADNSPSNYLLYGLGVGKPQDVVALSRIGFDIFDCVLPTRDGRHKRLYVYDAKSIGKIDISKKKFYSYVTPDKKIYFDDDSPVSTACDCLTCKNYSRAYLAHLFRIGDFTAGRLATIHNLRFYSILMEKLREDKLK